MDDSDSSSSGAATAPSPASRLDPGLVLVPLNEAAQWAVNNLNRGSFSVRLSDGTAALWLPFRSPDLLRFTFGAENADVLLPHPPGADIDTLQCSFFVQPETGAVLLCDHSRRRSTVTDSGNGEITIPFPDNKRQVLVARGINTRLNLGSRGYCRFALRWEPSDGLYEFPKDEPYLTGPRRSRNKKYIQGGEIGGGSFGTVICALSVFTGKMFAVKKFRSLEGPNLVYATREMRNMFRIMNHRKIEHEHILEILDVAGGRPGDKWGEIHMPLKRGSLKSLVMDEAPADYCPSLADMVLQQMLKALRCTAKHKIIHRDIKPENILYDITPNMDYYFCLADFGLSNDPHTARTIAGTAPFMAPEVYHRQSQTTKVDVWSLFATIVWVRNEDDFRTTCSQLHPDEIHDWLVALSSKPVFASYRTMAEVDPTLRPSAKELYKALYEQNAPDATDEDEDLDIAELMKGFQELDTEETGEPSNWQEQLAKGEQMAPYEAYPSPESEYSDYKLSSRGSSGPTYGPLSEPRGSGAGASTGPASFPSYPPSTHITGAFSGATDGGETVVPSVRTVVPSVPTAVTTVVEDEPPRDRKVRKKKGHW